MKKVIGIILISLLFCFRLFSGTGTYDGPAPSTGMSEPELEDIVENGDDEQSATAAAILAEIRRIKALLEEIAKLLEELKKIPSNLEEAKEWLKKAAEVKEETKKLLGELEKADDSRDFALEKTEDELDNKEAEKPGDPVNITTGSYEQSETDFYLNLAAMPEIKRRYDSDCNIRSSIGEGWYFSLDERIILGIEPNAENVYEIMLSNLKKIEQTIKTLKEDLPAAFEVSSVDGAESEIESRLSQSKSILERAVTLANTDGVEGSGNSLRNSAEAKVSALEEIKKQLREELEYISELEKEKVVREKEAVKYNKEVYTPTLERKKKNLYSLFPGMESYIEETGLNTLTIIDADGFPHLLEESEKNVWKKEGERTISECRSEGAAYKVTYVDGRVKTFDSAGFLVKAVDRNGNYVLINRDEKEKINSLETSYGEKYKFEYSGGFITKIINERSPEECVIYGYTGAFLESVTDTDGDTVKMEYDSEGKMKVLKKYDGSSVTFDYDEQTTDGKILATATRNEEGFAEKFIYFKSEKRTDYIDHDGNVTSYWYDKNHRTIKEVSADGSLILNEYDEAGNLRTRTENGSRVDYTYDARGNRIGSSYADGSNESWSYNSFNQLLSYTDRAGVRISYEYDERGNLTAYKTDGVCVYEEEVNEKGQLVKRTVHGQKNIITNYEYDEYGNLLSQTCGGVRTEYQYDSRNRLVRTVINRKIVDEYEYDRHKTVQKNYKGLETVYLTNGRKDLVKVIQKDTVTELVHVTRIEYDKRHLPIRVYGGDRIENEKNEGVEGEILLSSYIYTPAGKVKAEVIHGKESFIKVYEYKQGQINEIMQFMISETLETPVNETDLKRFLKEAGDNLFVQKYDYEIRNENHKVLAITDGAGIKNIFEYDSFGNLVSSSDGNGQLLKKEYRQGNLMKEQNPYGGWNEYDYERGRMVKAREQGSGGSTEVNYFPDGSISSQTDRYGTVTYYNYDERGRLTSLQSRAKKVWYEYDDFDRVTKEIVGNSPNENNCVYCVSYEYSLDGRAVSVTEGGKYKTVNQADAFGNIIKQVDGNTNERSYVYNYQNQMIQSSDGYGNITFYEYNGLGLINKVTLPDGSVTEYKYNSLGLLEKIIDDCGLVYMAVYDKAGRLERERNRADVEKSYKYDNGGRVKEVWCGDERIESYDYGSYSRTVTVKDGKGNDYIYKYDSFGRLVGEKNRKDFEQTYFYDADGQLESQRNFDGGATVITSSDYRSVRTVRYSDGSENRIVYDTCGNIIEAENEYGKTKFGYDSGCRLIYQIDEVTGEEIFFEYDKAGNRIRLYSSNRETKYTYGKNNEVKEIFDNKQRVSIKLEYNKVGREELRKYGNGIEETTLYDRAGRVTVKMQKNGRGEVLWAQGYVYGENGKRTATVDNFGCVTFYEYNKKGQLSAVYYPYTKEMENKLKGEAELNGLPLTSVIGENRFLTSGEKSRLVILLNSIQYGLAYNLPALHVLIKEAYEYDKNGNRTAKLTPFGKIEYTYDKENCLLSSGSRGQIFVTYSYDKNGNLLTEESLSKTIRYAYNAQNRLIYCEVTDNSAKKYAKTSYAYDAFGRRLLVQDMGQAALRTLYDGLTFDVIKQSPTLASGLFTDSYNTGIKYGKAGKPTGDRYRYLEDDNAKDSNRYVYLNDNTYRMSDSRYHGERTAFTANGTIAAQTSSDYGTEYFTTDLLGSVTGISNSYGSQKTAYTYDAFGSLVEGSLTGTSDYGYLGKQNDQTTSLYNYGYRDYNPHTARFTTVDPIRDSTNWFAYCASDPVNFVDPTGLFYYTGNGQQSITTVKKTTVIILRNNDGLGNSFDSTRLIYKNDGFNTKLVYVDSVGANCKPEYNGTKGSTTPDGTYYLSNKILKKQSDGTYNSDSYNNVLSLMSDDKKLTQQQRNEINIGDRLFHANQRNCDVNGPYNSNKTPGGAGCIIGKDGQVHQDAMMETLMDGVRNPEEITVIIRSMNNVGGKK